MRCCNWLASEHRIIILWLVKLIIIVNSKEVWHYFNRSNKQGKNITQETRHTALFLSKQNFWSMLLKCDKVLTDVYLHNNKNSTKSPSLLSNYNVDAITFCHQNHENIDLFFSKPENSLTRWIMICNFLKWNVHLILNAPFQARTLLLFYKFGWLTIINKITIERFLILFPKILDQRAPDYLSKKLLSMKYCKSQFDTRSPFALIAEEY